MFRIWKLAIETEKIFDATVANMHVSIDYLLDGRDILPIIFYYLEAIYISLWDTVFFHKFVVDQRVHKNHNIDKQLNFNPAMRRVFDIYFKHVLFLAKVISKSPIFVC